MMIATLHRLHQKTQTAQQQILKEFVHDWNNIQ